MTEEELIGKMTSIEGVRVMFKRTEEGEVRIFWKGKNPIASVYVHGQTYDIEYPKLYEMDLNHILQIDAWLHEYVHTPLQDRFDKHPDSLDCF